MKKITLILLVALTALASCTKQIKQQPIVKQLSYAELSKAIGQEAAFKLFDNAGKTEASPTARGAKQVKANATLATVEDLELSGSVECTVSANAQWGAIQRFLAQPLSNDGAESYCPHYWSRTGSDFPTPIVCPSSTPGVYRGWTSDAANSDTPYLIHLSNLVTIS